MVIYDENLLNQEQLNINSFYQEIGRRYCAEHKDNPDPAYAELVAKIAASEKKIADHKAAVLKENGLMLCPDCGEEISIRSVFCNFCGKRVVEEKPAEEPAAEEAPVEEKTSVEAPEEPAEESVAEEPAEEPVSAEHEAEETTEEAPAEPVCANCGAKLESGCLFCVECGTRVEAAPAPVATMPVRFCTECGYKVTDGDAMFCNDCGARLEGEANSNDIYSNSVPAGKTCPNCGFHTDDSDVLFCIECGTKLK